jgi:hypothetical protein
MSIRAPKRAPLEAGRDLSEVSAGMLREQLRYELWQVKEKTKLSNEELSLDLGYKSGTSVTKWLNDLAPISGPCAEILDRKGFKPTIGGTFVALHEAYVRAKRGLPREPRRGPRTYDVFLASPMASTEDSEEYRLERRGAQDVKAALENFCDLSVYYAGDLLETAEEFDPPDVAAEQNFEALENSQRFVLVMLTGVRRPSSVHVEAGYALARRLPSLYLVPDHKVLPFVLESLGQHQRGEILPPVSVQYVNSSTRAVNLIRKHGDALFTRLDGGLAAGKQQRVPARRKAR